MYFLDYLLFVKTDFVVAKESLDAPLSFTSTSFSTAKAFSLADSLLGQAVLFFIGGFDAAVFAGGAAGSLAAFGVFPKRSAASSLPAFVSAAFSALFSFTFAIARSKMVLPPVVRGVLL